MAGRSGTIRRNARLFALSSGPLTRRTDRGQALARLLVVAAVLASIPLAVVLSLSTYGRIHLQEAAEARSSRPATATLVEDALPSKDPSATGEGSAQSVVSWTTSSGAHGRAVVAVAPGAAAGSTVRVWIDRSGAASTLPPPTGNAPGLALGVGLLTVVVVATLAAVVYLLFRTMLDRRRLRAWTAGWAAVEPVWSGKVR